MAVRDRVPVLAMDLNVYVIDIGPYWLACERQLGILVFADSKDAAMDRLNMAVDFTLDTIDGPTQEGRQHLYAYLENHGVKYDRVEQPWVFNVSEKPEPKVFANVR